MLYASSSLSLACLEVLVHIREPRLPADCSWVRIEIPAGMVEQAPGDFNAGDEDACRDYGSAWAASGRGPVADVPSVIVPVERNLLLNPLHKDFASLVFSEPKPFRFDPRLLKAGPQRLIEKRQARGPPYRNARAQEPVRRASEFMRRRPFAWRGLKRGRLCAPGEPPTRSAAVPGRSVCGSHKSGTGGPPTRSAAVPASPTEDSAVTYSEAVPVKRTMAAPRPAGELRAAIEDFLKSARRTGAARTRRGAAPAHRR